MIDKITGSIIVDNENIILDSRLSPEIFMNTSLYKGGIVNTNYLLNGSQDINGKKFLVTLFFNNGKLIEVHLSEVIKGLSWDKWTEDVEIAKKKSHDQWLLKVLGKEPYDYPWGYVESVFDKKGYVSSIILRYNNIIVLSPLNKGVRIMEKGIFAKYIDKNFRVSNIDGDKIRLISEDQADLNNGFKEKIYPSNYKDRSNLPTLYIKEVKREEIDEIFEVDYKAKYKGHLFNLSFKKTGSQFRIGTSDAELAKQNGFERTDKYYYEKIVELNEIE